MMATVSEPSVYLWPNPGPLECGILYSGAGGSGKFSLHHLKKLLEYVRSKGKHTYPFLSYSVWSHIARSKFHLSEELAWLYFDTFDVISDVDASDRLHLARMTAKCSTKEDIDQLRKHMSVDTVKFLLFLYVQNAPRLSLKAPVMTEDEWPSPEAEKKQKSSEFTHLAFLKTHLSDILELLSETGVVSGDHHVSNEGMKALGSLICSSPDRKRLLPLLDIATTQEQAASNGYSKLSQVFSRAQLEKWLRAHLSLNPFGPQSLKGGARDKKCHAYRSDSIGRIVSNIQTAPEGCKCVLLHKISKQTLAKGEEGLSGASVHIQNCRGSSIYLLAPLQVVQVERCSHCLLVLGAVETALTINNCDSITVVTACRRLHVSASSLCTLHLLTPTRPVVFPPSVHLTFAPYNTHYPTLGRHLQQCGLLPTISCWSQPLCLGTAGDESDVWHLMTPEDFRPLVVPFKMEGETQDNPCPLPSNYQDKLAKRKERIKGWYEEVKVASLSEEQAQQLQASVQSKFQEWLEATGHKKEIVDLEVVKHKKQ